jgi:small multidrug resistance family-3 protein
MRRLGDLAWLGPDPGGECLCARTFAAYGGVYVLGALAWLALLEGARPTRWDLAGVGLCLAETLVILLGAR